MTNAMSLAGKRVIAIGGSSGIGFAVAALAQQQGADVVIASSNQANVDAAVARFDQAALGTPGDPEAQWAAVTALIAAGRETEADARLEKFVGRHVEHAEAVALMARRLEAREDESERAQQYSDLAERLRDVMERSEKPRP